MSALGYYLEDEGIATVSISLIREHTAALHPPRALWVPFMLGRPLGAPNDAAFQRKVLLAALQLLERDSGPVLEDFPDDAPYDDLGALPEAQHCPVSFPRMKSAGTLAEQLTDEIAQLQAWHAVAVQQHGRTTLGMTGLTPAALGAYVAAWLSDTPPPVYRAGMTPGGALKLATDELKTFYYEAKSVQPGRHSPDSMAEWFWLETAGGAAFLALRDQAAKSGEPSMKGLATLSLVPRTVQVLLAARGTA